MRFGGDAMMLVKESHKNKTYVINDTLWERLIELTDGAASLCYQCGVCTAACPWGLVRKDTFSVRTIIRKAQLGLQNVNDTLWLCTTCGQCHLYCPRGVNICEVFRSLRDIAWEEKITADGLPSLLWSVFWNGNPWAQPPSRRADWAKGLEIPYFDKDQHEILLFIGCTSSYDRRAQKISRSLVKVLQAANVRYGYLGENEPCCGEAVLSTGHKPYFRDIAKKTIEVFNNSGASHIVTLSPHCFDVFKNHYPTDMLQNQITFEHYTQYLAQLINDERLVLSGQNETSTSEIDLSLGIGNIPKINITYQDPCYLSRHNQEYLAPRQILELIPGFQLVEMEHHAEDGLCCGGGGGRMWLETAPGERFADLRIVEATNTNAEYLVTACPFCVVCLEDSVKSKRIDSLKVIDIAEALALYL